MHRNLFSILQVMSIISNLYNFKKPIQISVFIPSMNNMVQVLNQGNLLFLISEERFSFDFQR